MNNNDSSQEQIKALRFRVILSVILSLFILGGLYFRMKSPVQARQEYQLTRFYMDTYVEIIIVSDNPQKARQAQEAGFSVFEELDKKYNFHNPKSLLYEMNKKSEFAVEDKNFLELLKTGMDFSRRTDGTFDITLGGVRELYPIGKENPVPPNPDDIKKALETSGYNKIRLSGNNLEKPGKLLIDPGGILKGYAVDGAIEAIKRQGITDALVNGGGNIRVIGKNAYGENWKVGVQNPRVPDKIMAVISLDNRAVATSGDYQRYFFYNGIRYHHIIDPKTGEPARKAFAATVICPEAVMADAFSTAVFVMGKKKGMEFLKKEGLEGIIVDESGVEVTDGLKGKIELEYGK